MRKLSRFSALRPIAAIAAIALTTTMVACTAQAPDATKGATSATTADDPEKADLTYWYWAESDAPGANDWMKGRIAAYTSEHPDVHITLVPQATDTLIGAFTTAAQSKSGPDIATQWATMPVLSQVWGGAVTPISDLVDPAELDNWIGTQENTYDGKVWGMPIYLMGIPLAYNKTLLDKAGLAAAPTTYDELLASCSALRKVGVTPIGGGNKDGYFGAWFFSNFGKQQLDSVADLQNAVLGNTDIKDPKILGFYEALKGLQDAKCFNDDMASMTLDEGMSQFASGQAAMAWGTDGIVTKWAKELGEENIGVVATPKWGTGALADVYNTTQSSTAFITSWSKHPKAAAQFLSWLHEPENLTSWYDATGIFPADKRFDDAAIKTDLGKALWALTGSEGSVWLENYLPPSVDGDGDLPAGQVITSGGSVAEAQDTFAAAAEKWRTQNADEVKNYTAWASN